MTNHGPPGFHPEGIILGGKLQEMGVALYTFLYNCPKFWGGSFPPAPPSGWNPVHYHIIIISEWQKQSIQYTEGFRVV